MSSIGIKFENFMQEGCRDLGWHLGRIVYCRKPIILPKPVLFIATFLELPVLPSITCELELVQLYLVPQKSLGLRLFAGIWSPNWRSLEPKCELCNILFQLTRHIHLLHISIKMKIPTIRIPYNIFSVQEALKSNKAPTLHKI